MKKIHYVLGVCAIALMLFVGFLLLNKPDDTIAGAIYPIPFTNLIGSRTASTTVTVGFYGTANTNGTSTYSIPLLNSSNASIVFDPVTASSTTGGAAIYFQLLGSNDPECITAQTTITSGEHMTLGQIRWFDVSNHMKASTVLTGITNATTTFSWLNPIIGMQREIVLDNLDMNCLAIRVAASSTSLFAHYRLK